jgi:hypothetical protein
MLFDPFTARLFNIEMRDTPACIFNLGFSGYTVFDNATPGCFLASASLNLDYPVFIYANDQTSASCSQPWQTGS